jgi:membrane associated rhomboid family serine protease
MAFDVTSGVNDPQTARQDEAEQLVARGNELLLHEKKAADAAGLYSEALELAPNLLGAHLGMAEANFALGQFAYTRAAAEYVQRLAPDTTDAAIAHALLLCLDRRYHQALEVLDQAARNDPGRPYLHALRGYVYRCLHNDYDAALAEAKAARLAGGVDLRALFPRIDRAAPIAPAPFADAPAPMPNGGTAPRLEPVQPRQWQQPPAVRRTAIRARMFTSNYPVATYAIIATCVVVFLLQLAFPAVTAWGEQDNQLILQGQWWRLITVMFLHANIIHIFVNMLSLFFIGPFVERVYGTGRFLLLYFGTGLIASLAFLFSVPAIPPNDVAVGASGAIAGIFGVLGAFFFAYRSRLGPAGNGMLQQWFFWLGLNVILNITDPGLAWQAHLGGLISGIVLGFVFAPRLR